MVAWANAEALAPHRARPGFAHFWSRSRGALWKKGETSGHVLRVREVRADCDGDTLLLVVDPDGPGLPHRRAHLLRRATRRRAAGILDELARVIASAARDAARGLLHRAPAAKGPRPRAEEDRRGGHGGRARRQGRERRAPGRGERADLLFHLLVVLAAARRAARRACWTCCAARREEPAVKALASTTTSGSRQAGGLGARLPRDAGRPAHAGRPRSWPSPRASRARVPAGERGGRRAHRALLVPRPRPGGHARGARPAACCERGPRATRRVAGDLLAALRARLGRAAAEVPGLPRFTGGAVGYLAYDAVAALRADPRPASAATRGRSRRSRSTARWSPSTTCASGWC